MLDRENGCEWRLEGTAAARVNHRPTFRDLIEKTRKEAAGLAWERAKLASSLRHYAVATGQPRAARALALVKRCAVTRAICLMPRAIRVSVDEDYHVGLLSISWRGHGRLHLPANTQLPNTTRSVRPLAMTA